MGNAKERAGAAGVAVTGGVVRILLYIVVLLLIVWIGKTAFGFGYDVFNQQPMSPGDGQEVTVVIKNGASVYQIGKTLENKGLIEDAKVFVVQEMLSIYKGKLKPGTYVLSTAYTPDRMMAIMAGEEEHTGEGGSTS